MDKVIIFTIALISMGAAILIGIIMGEWTFRKMKRELRENERKVLIKSCESYEEMRKRILGTKLP